MKTETKGIFWRLSILALAFVVVFFAVVVCPINWLITGEYQLDPKGWSSWAFKWAKKVTG